MRRDNPLSSLKPVSAVDFARRLHGLRTLSAAHHSGKEIEQRVDRIMKDYLINPITMGGQALFRAQRNEGNVPFTSVRRLWYPPASKVTAPGRLNAAGVPLLYCADSLHAALFEMQPDEPSYYTILVVGERAPERRPLLTHIGLQHLRRSTFATSVPGGFREDAEFLGQLELLGIKNRWLRLDHTLAEIATRTATGDELRNLYRLTSAIGTFLLRSEGSCGIAYPSIATSFKALNFCLKSEVADAAYFPVEAWMISVDAVCYRPGVPRSEGRNLRIRVRRRSENIRRDGVIEWSPEASDFGLGDLATVDERLLARREAGFSDLSDWVE